MDIKGSETGRRSIDSDMSLALNCLSTDHFVFFENFQHFLSLPAPFAAAQDGFNAGDCPVKIKRKVMAPRPPVPLGQDLGRINVPIDQFAEAGYRNRIAWNATRAKPSFDV
jgi:hypothetical protein